MEPKINSVYRKIDKKYAKIEDKLPKSKEETKENNQENSFDKKEAQILTLIKDKDLNNINSVSNNNGEENRSN